MLGTSLCKLIYVVFMLRANAYTDHKCRGRQVGEKDGVVRQPCLWVSGHRR